MVGPVVDTTEPLISDRHVNDHPFLPALPDPYAWHADSLVLITNVKDKNVPTTISKYPIFLHNVQKGESKGWVNYSFRQHLPHDGWNTFTISAADMNSQGAAGALAKHGANISDPKAFHQYVKVAIDHYYASRKMDMTYEQMGWKENDTCFLLGQTLYTPAGKRIVETNDELRLRGRDLGPREGGSLAEWKRASHALFAAGCEAQSFMVFCGFGSPLIRFLDSTESGAVVAGTSTESGKGKTSSTIGATSIWGRKHALAIEKSYSSVTQELIYAALRNLPCIHDELRARDPDALRDFIIGFTGGKAKVRTSRAGELKHATDDWQNILLTADNYSLLDLVAGNMENNDEAPALRIIELTISIPTHLVTLFKDEIKDVMEKNSGYAGDVFLSFVVKNLDAIKAFLKTMYANLYAETKWEHKHRFWVRTIAAAAVGAIIAKQLGLIECSVERIIRWVIGILQERIAPMEKIWQIGALGHFLNSRLGQRLTVDTSWRPQKRNVVLIEPRHNELSVRQEQDTGRLMIASSALREYCIAHGQSYSEMVRYLRHENICMEEKRVILGAGTQYAGTQVWCLFIDGRHHLLTGIDRPQLAWSSSHDHQQPAPDAAAPRQR
jgi:hypothetical protein